MEAVCFVPQLTHAEATGLTQKYEAVEDAAALTAGAMVRGGDYSPEHLRTIFKWKTRNRGKSRLEHNHDCEVTDAFRLAVSAKTPRAAIAVLVGLNGVAVPVASAIATVIRPDVHTILDFRALHALGYKSGDRSIPFYLHYRAYCVSLARQWGMPLRDLDRALWQWSFDRGMDEGRIS
jgi:hypothetical protein